MKPSKSYSHQNTEGFILLFLSFVVYSMIFVHSMVEAIIEITLFTIEEIDRSQFGSAGDAQIV